MYQVFLLICFTVCGLVQAEHGKLCLESTRRYYITFIYYKTESYTYYLHNRTFDISI